MNIRDDRGSFWTTLPGILTGIAALITAIVTLYTVFYAPSHGVSTVGQTPIPTTPAIIPTPPAQTVISSIINPTPTPIATETSTPSPSPSPTPMLTPTPIPIVTTPAPVVTIQQPVVIAPAPVVTTPTPVITTPQPNITTPQPNATTPTPTASMTVAAVNAVDIKSTGFDPVIISVPNGTTVTWTNKDNTTHTVIGSGFDSGLLSPGQTFNRTFSTTGSYDYGDPSYPSMSGTVVVK
jgi:plastocyanin